MKASIRPRRRYGIVIPDRDWSAIPPMVGIISIEEHWITEVKRRHAAILHGTTSVAKPEVIALLFDPQIRSIAGSMMVLSGWEIIDRGPEGRQVVMQEWSCQIE